MRATAGTIVALALVAAAALPLAGATDEPSERSPTPAAAPSSAPVPAAAAVATESLAFRQPRWREIRADAGPAGREDHTWTVDAEGRFAYLFGGRSGARELGDLWRYDLRRDRWQRLSPAGRAPGRRFGHSAVWVEGSGLVIFAGQRDADFFADLWAFDPGKRRWRELPARGSVPKARYGSCLVVGRDGRLWVSHGFTTVGRFDDTRAYNLVSRRWASIAPAGRRPGERCLHDCFTTLAGDLVLYGGQDDGASALADLWAIRRDRTWHRHEDPALPARRLYAATEAGGDAYLFGGVGRDARAFDDLWHVDRQTLAFERLRPAGSVRPAARYGAALIADPERGRLLLFGGQASTARSDLWELVDGADPGATASAAPSPARAEPTPGDVALASIAPA